MSFRGKKVLITGGAGFIGSNLAHRMVQEGADVMLLDSMIEGYGANLHNLDGIKDRVHINFSDMRDEHTLKYVVREKDYIFHMAGQVSHQDSMNDPFMDLAVNARGTLALLEACRVNAPHAVLVYASTRQIYGKPEYLPVDEKHPLLPPDVNGINKLAAEQYMRLYNHVYDIPTVSLRLTNTYGPRQLISNARQGVIGWFVNRALLGETIQLYGGGGQLRDFNYVDDVVEAMCLAAENKYTYGHVYNLAGERASLKTVAETLISITGKGSIEVIPFPDERKKIDIGDFYGDSSMFEGITGWQAKTKLERGLKAMIDYYRDNMDAYIC